MAIEKRTGNETPRPVLGKTAKSQRVVRFVDLNDSLNKVEEAFVQLPENPSNGDALVFNSTTNLWEAGAVVIPPPTFEEIIVTNEILTTLPNFGDFYLLQDFNTDLQSNIYLEHILTPRFIVNDGPEIIDGIYRIDRYEYFPYNNNYYIYINGNVTQDYQVGDILMFDIYDSINDVLLLNQKRKILNSFYSEAANLAGPGTLITIDISDYDFLLEQGIRHSAVLTNARISRHFGRDNYDFVVSWSSVLKMDVQNEPVILNLVGDVLLGPNDNYALGTRPNNFGSLTLGSDSADFQTRGTVDMVMRIYYTENSMVSQIDNTIK